MTLRALLADHIIYVSTNYSVPPYINICALHFGRKLLSGTLLNYSSKMSMPVNLLYIKRSTGLLFLYYVNHLTSNACIISHTNTTIFVKCYSCNFPGTSCSMFIITIIYSQRERKNVNITFFILFKKGNSIF